MGCCFFSNPIAGTPTAKVIALDGSLTEFTVPTTASTVLATASSSHFLCNSDKLFLDRHIPSLGRDDTLEQDQIYFVLPVTKLKYPLSSIDMSALAVKASSAITVASKRGRGRRIRLSPEMSEVVDDSVSASSGKMRRRSSWRLDVMIRRQLSTSSGKMRRRSSWRLDVMIRRQLSTIQEAA